MRSHNSVIPLLLVFVFFASCKGKSQINLAASYVQNDTLIGGGCDGCELMYVGMPTNLQWYDTSAGWGRSGQKLLVTGRILHRDGHTPAAGVILYYWHTDANGYYAPGPGLPEPAKRHGYLRGWIKTDNDGQYQIYTIRPAAYPGRHIPAHIHLSLKEPGLPNEYYVDELVFDDDKLLTTPERKKLENRGGSGVLRTTLRNDILTAEHDIILGLNIPFYPGEEIDNSAGDPSTISVGEDCPSFTPLHVYGADKGTRTCPICKYGGKSGILYFVSRQLTAESIKSWAQFLDDEAKRKPDLLKVFFIFYQPGNSTERQQQQDLISWAVAKNLSRLSFCNVPDFQDHESEVFKYGISESNKNTIVFFRHSNVKAKFINAEAGLDQLQLMHDSLGVLLSAGLRPS
jgi:protocatechuate 3,4-dioxygenase, beta subunit